MKCCPILLTLRLENQRKILAGGYECIGTHCKALTSLTLINCSNLDHSITGILKGLGTKQGILRHFQLSKVRCCEALTINNTYAALVNGQWSKLESLILSGNKLLEFPSLFIRKILQSTPRLRSLNMAGNDLSQYKSAYGFGLAWATHLTEINLTNCSGVSESMKAELRQHNNGTLTVL
jgi:hypothetical protein